MNLFSHYNIISEGIVDLFGLSGLVGLSRALILWIGSEPRLAGLARNMGVRSTLLTEGPWGQALYI
jgi:hypothetical protein